MVQEEDKSVLLSSHNLDEVQRICNRVALIHHGEVRLYGRTRRNSSGRRAGGEARIRTAEALDDALLDRVKALPGVTGAGRRRTKCSRSRSPTTTCFRLWLPLVATAGARIREVTGTGPGLEELYLNIVREAGTKRRSPAMRRMWIIAKKDIADVIGVRSTYLYVFVMLLASSSYFFSYFSIANQLTKAGASPEAILATSRIVPGEHRVHHPGALLLLRLPDLHLHRGAGEDQADPRVAHGHAGHHAGDLAGQVHRRGRYGRASSGWAVSVFSYLVISLAEVMPRVHQFIAPPPLAIVSGLIVVPLLVLSTISLVTHLQLIISNPRVSNFIFVAVFLVVLGVLLVSVYSLPGGGLNQRYFLPIFLGLAVVVGVISRRASRPPDQGESGPFQQGMTGLAVRPQSSFRGRRAGGS